MKRMMKVLSGCVFVLIGLGLLYGCCRKPEASDQSNQQAPTQDPETKLPDLAIVSAEIIPAAPRRGEKFAVEVRIENIGRVKSGEYDLEMVIKDVSRMTESSIATLRRSALQAGQRDVWRGNSYVIDKPGAHQLRVTIEPSLPENGQIQNNTFNWAFQVTP
jgi:hypothetical protein